MEIIVKEEGKENILLFPKLMINDFDEVILFTKAGTGMTLSDNGHFIYRNLDMTYYRDFKGEITLKQ